MKPDNLRRGFTLVELLVSVTVMAVLASVAIPAALAVPKLARTAADSSNLRVILGQMQLFQAEKGTYPTAGEEFIERMSYVGVPRSSNDYFAQLFTEKLCDGGYEELFYVEHHPVCYGTLKPDGIVTDDEGVPLQAEILSAGECGYQYVAGLSASSPTNAPMILDAPRTGVPGSPFDHELRGGKALAALVNYSVVRASIDADSPQHLYLDGGASVGAINDPDNLRVFGDGVDAIRIVGPLVAD